MNKKSLLLVTLSAVLFLNACRKRDAVLPDNLVNFEVTTAGISEQESSISFKVKLDRQTNSDISVVIHVTEQGAVYGTDYTTTPVVSSSTSASGQITLTIPSGNNEAGFTIQKVNGALFDGDEKLVFDIYSSGNPVLIGVTKQLTVSFSELVATSASTTINGGGATFPNKVFIDLSANRQTLVNRTNWDLGFYSGSDDFRVILNSSSAMMAKMIDKNDLTTVTAADTAGFSQEVAFSQTNPQLSQLPYIDYPNGDLTRTAIASISANATDNKVYIVNRGLGIGSPAPARGWKKIRVIRNASGGYTLQHADIASATFASVDIPKEEAYFFNYVSFDNGRLNVEPEKKKWDIAWTYFSNATNFGTGEVPYLFQDIILQNRNVQAAKVMTATKAYADFSEADIATQTFAGLQTSIGSDWRSGGGPSSAPAVRTDRYYIIKDGDNNYYKLRFTALTQNSERGYPAFEAVLVKRGG